MTKKEFEKLLGSEVSEFDYALIETVYTWHPTISNENGKQEIASAFPNRWHPYHQGYVRNGKGGAGNPKRTQ